MNSRIMRQRAAKQLKNRYQIAALMDRVKITKSSIQITVSAKNILLVIEDTVSAI